MPLNSLSSLNNRLVDLRLVGAEIRKGGSMAGEATSESGPEEETPKKGSKIPLILGILLALMGGAGGFFAVQQGMIGGASKEDHAESQAFVEDMPELAFVPLETLVINLPASSDAQHLLFTAQLEVNPAYASEVSSLLPRIVDVLNGYLRAVKVSELENPTALIRLRAQMLRRVQVVVGEGRVNDLLIMEFVLN